MAAALSLNLALPMVAMPASLAPMAAAAGDGGAGMNSFADLLAGATDLGPDAPAMAMPTLAAATDPAAPALPATLPTTLPATPPSTLPATLPASIPGSLLAAQAPTTPAPPAANPADAWPVDAVPLEPKAESSVAGDLPASWLQNFERVLADAQALLDARPWPGEAQTAAALDEVTLEAGPWLESDVASLDETTSVVEDPAATEGLPPADATVAAPVASLPATPAPPNAAMLADAAAQSGDLPDPAANALRTGAAAVAHASSGGVARGQRVDRGVPAQTAAPGARGAAAALSNPGGTESTAPAQAQTAEPTDRASTALLASTAPRGSDGPTAQDPQPQAAAQASGSAGVQPPAASSSSAIANAALESHTSEVSLSSRDAMPAERPAHAEVGHAPGATHGAPRMTEATSFAATLKQAFEAPLSATPGTPGFAPALGVQLSTLLRNGVAEARLHLHPAELGPIAVQIALEGTAAKVQLAADHNLTRQALEQALPQLAGALRDAGFTLAGGSVSGQGAQAGDFTAHAGHSGPRNGAGGNTAGQDAAGGAGGAGSAGAEAPARTLAGQARRGLVDLYA